jgi:hypothetical protein
MGEFVAGTRQKLRDLREQAVRILSTLSKTDSSKKDFYVKRAADLSTVSIEAATEHKEDKKVASPPELHQEALSALDADDLSRLEQLLQKLMESKPESESKSEFTGAELGHTVELGEDLLYSFSEETFRGARKLGLAPMQTRSRREFAYLIRHGWRPAFLKDEVKQWSKDQLSHLAYPSGTTSQARDAIEFYLLNPFITSGGTRLQVCLVVEDLLVEDFPESDPRQVTQPSELLRALGFESRWGLARTEIEDAILQHGPRILKQELGVNPEAFRLVAIPPDIFTHFAEERGWGKKEIWTHFDGYRLREGGQLQALAGGNKRYGGAHNLVSFSPSLSRETLMARFAVVQRKRMMTWHAQIGNC